MGRLSLPIRLFGYLIVFLLAELVDHKGRSAHGQNAAYRKHPSAVRAGLGQLKALGVHHGKGHHRMDRAVICLHLNSLAVDGGGSGEQGPVTDRAGFALGGGDDQFDIALEQVVILVRGDLSDCVLVVLKALDDDPAFKGGYKLGRLFFPGNMLRHIVNAVYLFGFYIVTVRVVVEDELDIPKVPRSIGKLLRHVDAIAVNMGVILESVGILGVSAAPCECDGVGVAAVAADQPCVNVQGTGIGDAHSAVGVATVQAVGAIDVLICVDLCKAGICHGDGHSLPGGQFGISHIKFPGSLVPCVQKFGALLICVELDKYVILIVGNALGQFIHKGVLT